MKITHVLVLTEDNPDDNLSEIVSLLEQLPILNSTKLIVTDSMQCAVNGLIDSSFNQDKSHLN